MKRATNIGRAVKALSRLKGNGLPENGLRLSPCALCHFIVYCVKSCAHGDAPSNRHGTEGISSRRLPPPYRSFPHRFGPSPDFPLLVFPFPLCLVVSPLLLQTICILLIINVTYMFAEQRYIVGNSKVPYSRESSIE